MTPTVLVSGVAAALAVLSLWLPQPYGFALAGTAAITAFAFAASCDPRP